jgi:hypothetical protein
MRMARLEGLLRATPCAAIDDVVYMKPSFLFSTLGLCFALGIPLAFSQVNASEPRVVAEYKGGENPLEGSDTQWKNSGRITNGEVVTEPEQAWRIWRGEIQGALNFFLPDPENVLAEIRGQRWRMTARLRLDLSKQPNVQPNGAAMSLIFNDPGEEYAFNLCYDQERQQAYVKINRRTIPLPDLDVEKFHEFSIEFDPSTQQVNFLLDGKQIGESTTANPVNERWRVFWGQRSVNSPAASEWASVKLEVIN